MTRLATLKAATCLGDLARMLSFKPSALSYILYKQSEESKYSTFTIAKRNGGHRTIHAPSEQLKLVQRRLSDLLQDCSTEIDEATGRKDCVVHGFRRGRSIITNARRHRHSRYVFNVDLEDFFPAINFGRVRGFLIKNRDFALHERVATVIAKIACHSGSLPQGAPCSPVISNLVAHVLDMRLVKLATSCRCSYSRYADDLTFSTNLREFPPEIAVFYARENQRYDWLPGGGLSNIVLRSGFQINEAKTHMAYRRSRQTVTGLIVNEKINVRSEYRRNVRAMVRRLVTTGSFELAAPGVDGAQARVLKREGSLDELHGMLGFVDAVDIYNAGDSMDFTSTQRAYRQFLFYRNFYAAERPVIICEGDTDNVYLTHAVRSLAADFPSLAEKIDGKIRLKVRIYKYARSSTARLLKLNDGGAAVLARFIAAYGSETGRFVAPAKIQPVIVLYDNDSGATSIRNTIKQVTKAPFIDTGTWTHIGHNLYAMPIPLPNGVKEAAIEDCFDEQTRAVSIDGKTFSTKIINPDKEYGKKVFAHRVVKERADKINFEGFRTLLKNIVDIIEGHSRSNGS